MEPLRSRASLALAFASLFALSALAGCLGDGERGRLALDPDTAEAPAPVLHSVAQLLSFEAAAVDGTPLRGHVYLPNGKGPFATILEFSPYWNTAYWESENATERNGTRTTLRSWLAKFLDAGFAVALVNIRGTGESGGCKSWMDPGTDGADAYAVVQGLAAQPWSNGNVGMIGHSWPGYTQMATLQAQPPALKAVAPSSAIIDLWTLFTRRGPPIISQFGPMATTYAAFTALTAVGEFGDTSPEHLACPGYLEQVRAFNDLNVNGDKSPFFQARDMRAGIARSSVPMWVNNGLLPGEGHILQFEGLWDLMPAESRLLLGQWPHAQPQGERGKAYDREIVAWFDHYLRGGPQTVATGVVEYQDDTGAWHTTDRWPPTSTPVTLHLSDRALVANESDVVASQQSFLGDNRDALPYDCPGLQALYVSPPLPEDVELAGNFRANLTVSSTLPNGNIGVYLYHLPELPPCSQRGQALEEVADEIIPLWNGEVRRALSDLRHRGHLEQGRDFPVAAPDVMRMTSHPFASVAKKGERLVVAVGGGSIELAERAEAPLLTVLTGPELEGHVTIPVVRGNLTFEGDAGAGAGALLPRLP